MIKFIVSKKIVSIALITICLSTFSTINCFAYWGDKDKNPLYNGDDYVECTPSCPQVEDTKMVEYNGECISNLLEGDYSTTDDVYEEPTKNFWKFIY